MNVALLGPYKRNQKLIQFLKGDNCNVFNNESPIDIYWIEKNKISLIICSGYEPIINKDVIEFINRRIINLHISYLPFGRGIYPLFWSILNGDTVGITIHAIDENIDTGQVIFQEIITYSDDITINELHSILLTKLNNLFMDNW